MEFEDLLAVARHAHGVGLAVVHAQASVLTLRHLDLEAPGGEGKQVRGNGRGLREGVELARRR